MTYDRLLISCEHASNAVPDELAHRFVGAEEVLATHRGWDIGTSWLSDQFAHALQAYLVKSRWTRLVTDTNRSAHNPEVFSEYTQDLPPRERAALLQRYWRPYRQRAENWIKDQLRADLKVLHLSVHSFTPVLDGDERDADVGLLYDPKREVETSLAKSWQESLRGRQVLGVRRNYPYTGDQDGFVPSLQEELADQDYAGIQLEVNQAILEDEVERAALAPILVETFAQAAGLEIVVA